ncbi:hypothetical protein NDK43_07310 [Neobacillus pocheonensis]|uniref:Uncharacterized protein n=1 Tax=Neobacillus pocheonensis TaxID=363869 RepID=A0ABT0W7E7_9BACI|nr:hypothetical protein [Neobacillus pocheonensis]
MIAKKIFEPAGFQLKLGVKDCNLVLNEANATQTPLPLASLLHNRLLASAAKGRENQDWSGFNKNLYGRSRIRIDMKYWCSDMVKQQFKGQSISALSFPLLFKCLSNPNFL